MEGEGEVRAFVLEQKALRNKRKESVNESVLVLKNSVMWSGNSSARSIWSYSSALLRHRGEEWKAGGEAAVEIGVCEKVLVVYSVEVFRKGERKRASSR